MIKKILSILLVVAFVATMAVSSFAVPFTPSVETKQAPKVIPQTDTKGNECAAIIYDESGKEVVGVPFSNLVVTPISAIDTLSPENKEKVEAAYNQIKSADSLSDISPELESVIKDISPDLTLKDLVVRDVYDVSVIGDYAEYMNQNGNSISIHFDLSTDSDALISVLNNTDGTEWELIPDGMISRNDDSSVDVVLFKLGTLVFIFDIGKLYSNPNDPRSPDTGDNLFESVAFVASGALIVFAAVCFVVKKDSAQNA